MCLKFEVMAKCKVGDGWILPSGGGSVYRLLSSKSTPNTAHFGKRSHQLICWVLVWTNIKGMARIFLALNFYIKQSSWGYLVQNSKKFHWKFTFCSTLGIKNIKKSRIRETLTLSVDADRSTDTKKNQIYIYIYIFKESALGRFFHRVAMSVCLMFDVCPFSRGIFWGLFCPHFPKSDVQNF